MLQEERKLRPMVLLRRWRRKSKQAKADAANNGERNYYAAKDGSYFYIDQTGSKVFVSREEYDQHQ